MINDQYIGRLLFDKSQDQLTNPLLAQLIHKPFPEVAHVLRAEGARITLAWDVAVRAAMPQMRRLSLEELKDSTPEILLAIANALASDNPESIRELLGQAPEQGLSRLRLNFDVIEVMQEDRLLRAIIVQHVEAGLKRRMDTAESAALHAAIDVMLQRSVVALVEKQKLQLRAAAETELKFLSYLSHDLNNNLGSVTLSLDSLAMDLEETGGFVEARESLEVSRRAIADTVAGMRQMLDHERVRHSGAQGRAHASVDLHELATRVTEQFAREARGREVRLVVMIPPGTQVHSDGELLVVVLQNLIGNGVKYAGRGTVCVGADLVHSTGSNNGLPLANEPHSAGAVVWVSDDGPGITPAKLGQIFEAFQRGEIHGQPGVGLGLAIASQAARLLGARLTAESLVGTGSIFRLALPKATQRQSAPRSSAFVGDLSRAATITLPAT